MTPAKRALYHAPPRISDLHGDERRRALVARAEAQTDAWLASHTNPAPTIFERIKGVFRRGS